MSVLALAAAAALRLLDPTGDAAGDGTLMPPTSPVYANSALFDIQEVALTPPAVEGEPAVLSVAMGAIELEESMPAGFNRVVVDVYVDDVEGGAGATLDGPSMLMPPGRGWEYAVRVSPRGAFGAVAPLDQEVPVEWQPLPLTIDGDVFFVTLPWALSEDAEAYAVSGLYDAFAPSDWRAIAAAPSPWAFSSEGQVAPVVDLLAADQATQVQALQDGVLPAPVRPRDTGLPWLLLALAGVLIAGAGLWLRRRVPAPAREAPAEEPLERAPEVEEPADAPPSEEEPVESVAEEEPSEPVAEEEPSEPVALEEPSEPEAPAATDATETAVAATSPEADPEEDPLVGPAEATGERPERGPRAFDSVEDAWTRDDEADEDDISAFVATDVRRSRELRVEHSDEDEVQ